MRGAVAWLLLHLRQDRRIYNPAVQHIIIASGAGGRLIRHLRGFVAGHRSDFVHGLVDTAQNVLGGEQLFVVLGIWRDKGLGTALFVVAILQMALQDASPLVSSLPLRSSGTSCSTVMSGSIPFA